MGRLSKIPIDRLPDLRDFYKADWPLHISTYSTIQLFIDRFAKHPQWIKRVSFLSMDEDWEDCGAFIMTNQNQVFFNTLEAFPFPKLRKALILMDFEDKLAFVNIRDGLRTLLLDLIRIHYFEVVSDIGTTSYLMPRDGLLRVNLDLPDDLELKPLRKEHAERINALWLGRFEGSEKFIEEAIELNPSMGVYRKTGELLAWNMRIDNGSMGVGQVDLNNRGNLYGHLAILGLAVKIAREFDTDVHFEIANGNAGAEKLARRSNLEMIDTQSWIKAKKRSKLTVAPIWSHI